MKKTKCNKGGGSNIKRFEILEVMNHISYNQHTLAPTSHVCYHLHKNPTNNKEGVLLTHSCST